MRPALWKNACAALGVAAALLATAPRDARAEPPADWFGGGEGYERSLDATEKHGGKSSGCLKSTGDGANAFGTLLQFFKAEKYRGKRLRLSAFVKSEDVEGWSGLWMRVDGKEKTGLAFDNMMGRPIKGTNGWEKYEIVLDVPDDAEEIYYGALLAGKGKVWVDDVTFDAVGKDVAATGLEVAPMDRQGDPNPNVPDAPKNLDFER
jgi:hypothetical protein